MIAAAQRDDARFIIVLSSVVPLAELERWLAGAQPGHQAIYATGIDLPRATDTVRQVTAWKDDGLVTTLSRRDPADRRRFQYLIEKAGEQAPRSPAAPVDGAGSPPVSPRAVDRSNLRKLLSTLRSCAERGQPCPSLSAIADELGLAVGEAGRQQAAHLMRRLRQEGRIRTEGRANRQAPVVFIVAPGRACGKATA